MSHLDPDQLALLALDEPVASDIERAHLAACADCAGQVRSMRRAAVIARSIADDGAVETPPPEVWERISAELGFGRTAPQTVVAPTAIAAPATGDDLAESRVESPRSSSSRRRTLAWVLAAAVVVVAVIGSAWVVGMAFRPVQIAAASLSALPAHSGATGAADVDESPSGERRLRVTLEGASADGYREVWLLRADASGLVSLGVLEGTSGTFPIPAGVDLAEYRLVDVSAETVDGDPAHSGDSIARGELAFA